VNIDDVMMVLSSRNCAHALERSEASGCVTSLFNCEQKHGILPHSSELDFILRSGDNGDNGDSDDSDSGDSSDDSDDSVTVTAVTVVTGDSGDNGDSGDRVQSLLSPPVIAVPVK
jgi:hypothetical protein